MGGWDFILQLRVSDKSEEIRSDSHGQKENIFLAQVK